MEFSIYEASVPVFVHSLSNMRDWLDLDAAAASEKELMEARLAPDMRPLAAQFQMASDTAKNAIGRLSGSEAPSMADTEASFGELKDRCDRTIAYLESIEASAIDAGLERDVVLKFPNGTGYRFKGRAYLTDFALPNFFFHVTTAYAILRAAGIPVGKADFLRHLGPPVELG
jgi:hypothetical protein